MQEIHDLDKAFLASSPALRALATDGLVLGAAPGVPDLLVTSSVDGDETALIVLLRFPAALAAATALSE